MARLQDFILVDTRANQPAASASNVGALFAVSDENYLIERSNGATWDQFGPVATGDVVGPASATDDHIATFDTGTGKLLQDGGATIAGLLAAAVAAAAADIIPIALASEVAGDLPLANLAPAGSASLLLGRRSGSAGDWEEVTLGGRGLTISAGKVLSNFAESAEIRAALTPPVNADYSWVNQGSSAIRDDTDSVVLTGAATGSGGNLVLRVKTAPATPWVMTAYILPCLINKPFHGYGLYFRDSGTGLIHAHHVIATGTTTEVPRLTASKWNSATGLNSHYQTLFVPFMPRWMRISDDGTNRKSYLSADGVDWLEVHSIGRTDFLTANQCGFGISTENTATPNSAPIIRMASIKFT